MSVGCGLKADVWSKMKIFKCNFLNHKRTRKKVNFIKN